MKISKQRIREIIREELLNEQPPTPPQKKKPQPPEGGGDTTKDLKIDIPDSPFNPDVGQVTSKLKDILKQWKVKQYPSDKHRWVEYHKDIVKLVQQIQGEIPDEL